MLQVSPMVDIIHLSTIPNAGMIHRSTLSNLLALLITGNLYLWALRTLRLA
jgi:hypothetical protein